MVDEGRAIGGEWVTVASVVLSSPILTLFDLHMPISAFGDRHAERLSLAPGTIRIAMLLKELESFGNNAESHISTVRLLTETELPYGLTWLDAQGTGDGTFIGLADPGRLERLWVEAGPLEIYLPGRKNDFLRARRDSVLKSAGLPIRERVRPENVACAGETETYVAENFESGMADRGQAALRSAGPELARLSIPWEHYCGDTLAQLVYRHPFAALEEEGSPWIVGVNMDSEWGGMFNIWCGVGEEHNEILIKVP